jgi:hypothetical protein
MRDLTGSNTSTGFLIIKHVVLFITLSAAVWVICILFRIIAVGSLVVTFADISSRHCAFPLFMGTAVIPPFMVLFVSFSKLALAVTIGGFVFLCALWISFLSNGKVLYILSTTTT